MCTVETRCRLPDSRPCILLPARNLAKKGSFGGCLAIAGSRAIDICVDIYWSAEQRWMSAKITAFDPPTGLHSVRYLDGQVPESPQPGMWLERVRLSASAPPISHEAAAGPGDFGWYPGEEVLAAEAAKGKDAGVRAERMAASSKLVKDCVEESGVDRRALMDTIQTDEFLRSTAVGSSAATERLQAIVQTHALQSHQQDQSNA